MSVKLVVDMNLSPDWVPVLNDHGWQAIHWSAVGDPRSPDTRTSPDAYNIITNAASPIVL